jgi:hypothetical protein
MRSTFAMPNTYQLEKTTWTDADFEQMSWHDCHIHAFSFSDNFELLLDIDYLFKWVQPKKGSRYYSFWIAPCTLIFENVYDISFESDYKQPIIDYIERSNPTRTKNAEYIDREFEFDWNIVMVNAEMSFKSVGFKQYVRQKPILIRKQSLEVEIRKGISFDKIYEVLKSS